MSRAVLGMIVFSVVLSAFAQISLKQGMSQRSVQEAFALGGTRTLAAIARSSFVWLGIMLYGLGMLLWLGVLANIDVSQAYPFVGLGFLLTMLFGIMVLGEDFSLMRLLGTGLVLAGVTLVAIR